MRISKYFKRSEINNIEYNPISCTSKYGVILEADGYEGTIKVSYSTWSKYLKEGKTETTKRSPLHPENKKFKEVFTKITKKITKNLKEFRKYIKGLFREVFNDIDKDEKDFKKLYRKLAQQYHPDHEGGSNELFKIVKEVSESFSYDD